MIDRKSVLLMAASSIVGLLFCEGALRVLEGRKAAQPVPTALSPDTAAQQKLVVRYAAEMAAGAGTDRAWFLQEPPPLPNRTQPPPEAVARYDDFVRRGLYGPQSQYVWNRKHLDAQKCQPGSLYEKYPDMVLTFEPPSGTTHPIFRFPPNQTLASGLVTNQFGLRGPEVALVKPPKRIRIAFVGASTTVIVHSEPFSPAERVVNWLNLYARAKNYGVEFEVLNAGREGINSEDISAIVRDELAALDPDLVVYYEGSNQFGVAVNLAALSFPGAGMADDLLKTLETDTALGRLLARISVGKEPRKPAHGLKWPRGTDPRDPDIESHSLPISLPIILGDLDRIREAIRPAGGRLVLCSFEWLASDGLVLSPVRHRNIYDQLNQFLWPLRYAEIRTVADFQNLVFRRYAEKRGIDFLDIAGAIPQDPDLFTDAIHMSAEGERLKAWIIFQQLAPVVSREIDAGRLPKVTDRAKLPPPASYQMTERPARCR